MHKANKLKASIFDMDGTLVDAPYDWKNIKEELNTQGKPILTYIQGLAEPEKTQKWKQLENIEKEATKKAVLKEGIPEFLAFLKERGIKVALVTNNRDTNVGRLLRRYGLRFDAVLTRDGGSHKPSGDPLREAARRLGLSTAEVAAVGDAEIDLRAGNDAAIGRVIMVHPQTEQYAGRCHHAVRDLSELRDLLSGLLGNDGGAR